MIPTRTASCILTAIATAAALAGTAGRALAAEECGAPGPGAAVVCTPDNYDAAEHGNIHYAQQVPDGDFSLRLDEGLTVTYDRDDPDDVLVSDLVRGGPEHFSAVLAAPLDPAHAGDIALTSSADVSATGFVVRSYLVGRIGGRGGVALDLQGGSVSTEGAYSSGLAGFHLGQGDMAASIQGTTIRGQGFLSNGVSLMHTGAGHVVLDADAPTVDLTGDHVRGIFTDHVGTGDSLISVRGGAVSVSGNEAKGLFGYHAGVGDGAISLRDTAVTASGDSSEGVHLTHQWLGELMLSADGAIVDVTGAESRGIVTEHFVTGDVLTILRGGTVTAKGNDSRALWLRHRGSGELTVDAERTGFRAQGAHARAINAFQSGNGGIDIDLRAGSTVAATGDGRDVLGIAAFQARAGNTRIAAEGGSISAVGDSSAFAVYAQHLTDAEGHAVVDLADATVTADGEASSGVRISHFGTYGNLSVRLRDTRIAATGKTSGGVDTFLSSGNGSIRIDIDGGAVVAEGDGAIGVGIGLFDPETGAVLFAADAGADGYRDQTVKANAPVRGGSGGGAGIRLAGGGRVEIGADGSVGADSGVAIRALGDGAALHVSADFDGRRPGDVFDGDIRNDAGRTMIVVDGVTLHDPLLGATGTLIPRGARDLTLVADDTVLGRTFSAADFVEPLAPRTAVYETLPDFLFRLAAPGGRSPSSRGAGGFAGLEYGEGSIEAARTTTGAAYDFERSAAVMTLSGSPGPRLRGWIELHHGEGATQVASLAGPGTVDAVFTGYRAGAAWQGSHWYASAALGFEDYLLDIATARRGLLGAGIDAQGRSLGIELGRRIPTREGTAIVPRAWLVKAEVTAESFVDAVNAAVYVPDTERSRAGIGVEAKLTRELAAEAALTYGGFADFETISGDSETLVLVAGEPLTFQAAARSLAVGLDLNYRRGRFSLDAGLFTRNTLDTGSSEHGARLHLGGLF